MLHEKNYIKDLVRILLVFMIAYYLPVSLNLAGPVYETAAAEEKGFLADGMGGSESAVSMETVSLAVKEAAPLEVEGFSRPKMLLWTSYTVKQGEAISTIAANFNLKTGTLVSVNDIKNPGTISAGKTLKIPNQDGIVYKIAKDDTLESIAKKHKVETKPVIAANELFSDKINVNSVLFLTGAEYEWPKVEEPVRRVWEEEQKFNGDLFIWPLSTGGRITSGYGYRRSPFTRRRSLHPALDIAAPTGTPIRAAMAGTVSAVGWSDIYGNFVVINHQDGYRSLYGHMEVSHTQPGAVVQAGDIIGEVGSTGQSTGPHLHFEAYLNGATFNPIRYIKR